MESAPEMPHRKVRKDSWRLRRTCVSIDGDRRSSVSNKNRPGHPARRAPAKSLKEKRAAKRAKRESHKAEHNDTVEKTFARSH